MKDMTERERQRERLEDAILGGIGMDIDDELAAGSGDVSESAKKQIKSELLSGARHVLDSLTLIELQSGSALGRFRETMMQETQMRLHLYLIDQSRYKDE